MIIKNPKACFGIFYFETFLNIVCKPNGVPIA